MGGLRSSGRVITRVFSLHVGLSRHFTRLRHTLKRVILCCFSLRFVVDIGRIYNRVLHYFGLFFYAGQFKSCFPHRPEMLINQASPDFLYLFETPKSLKNPSPSNVLPHEKHE